MNVARFATTLAQALRPEVEPVDSSPVWRLPEPLPLAPLLDEVLEGDEERDEYGGTFEVWPGNVQELLEAHGLHRPLLSLAWDGFGPISWACGFASLDAGGRSYLCFWDENESYRLLAAVAPAGAPTALQQLVVEAIAGGSLVGFVAQEITNEAPDILERSELEEAFARLLDRTDGWEALAEDYFARIVEPNALERSLDQLKRVSEMSESARRAWREGKDAPDVPVERRRALLQECFDHAYDVIESES